MDNPSSSKHLLKFLLTYGSEGCKTIVKYPNTLFGKCYYYTLPNDKTLYRVFPLSPYFTTHLEVETDTLLVRVRLTPYAMEKLKNGL